MSHKKAHPEALSRLGSVTDLMSLRSFPNHSLIDHRHKERFRHKRILDALNVQTRQGIPIQRSLVKLQAEAEKILHDRIRLSDDETQIFVASLAECQLRICLESELDLAGSLYWDCLFWQDRIASPLAAWLEAGPFTWFQDEDEALTPEDKLESLQNLMGQINVGTGLIQQHLTKKIVNTDVMYLAVWSHEALTIIDDILDDDFESPGRLHMERSGRLLLPTDAASSPPSSSASDLRECMARLATLRARISLRAARFQTLITPLHAPSFWRRRWLYALIATPFVLISFKWIWGKRGEIPTWVAQAVESTREFFTEHVSEPSKAIFKELIWNEHESITDVAALEDAKQSLARMLADFVKDTNPKLSEEERKKLAESMDMSVVSSRYEQTLPQAMKHIVSGEIVRMLLIQVQFIKKELLVAMRGIDDVMNSNNLNFRLMAIFPAVLAVYGTYQGSKAVTYKLTRRKGRRETIMLLRSFLLSMERMLNLRNVGASENEIKYLKLDRSSVLKPILGSAPIGAASHSLSLSHSLHQHQHQHHLSTSLSSSAGAANPPLAATGAAAAAAAAGGGGGREGELPLEAIRQMSADSNASGGSYTVYEDLDEDGNGGGGGGRDGGRVVEEQEDDERDPPIFLNTQLHGAPNISAASTWGDLEGGNGSNPDLRVVFLKPEDLGVLLLLINQFAGVIQRTSSRFLTDLELRNLQEDLNEIAGNCGPVTVQQQLSVVQRMHRSYRFLQLPAGSLLSGL